MQIREADFERDGDQILAGAWNFVTRIAETEWIPTDRDAFEDYLLALLGNPAFRVFVAEDNGAIVAGIGLAESPFMWYPEMTSVEELFWWAAPDAPPRAAIAVLRHAVNWARSRAPKGEVFLTMKYMQDSSPATVGRIYDRMGLHHVEISQSGVI